VSVRCARNVFVSVGLVLSLVLLGCDSSPDPVASRGRVAVIGIDGASMRVIEPMLEAGRLPNLERLSREGVMGPLRSAAPISSPRIWNSIATGKVPIKHGVVDFAERDENGDLHLLLSHDRRAHAIWNILSDLGLSVSVINMWNTFPPEKVRGVMVSDHLLSREIEGRESFTGAVGTPVGALVYPEELQSELSILLRDSPPLVEFQNPFLVYVPLPLWTPRTKLAQRFDEDAALALFAYQINVDIDPDFMMLLLPGIDRVSHHLWGALEPAEDYPPNVRMSEKERYGARWILESYYEFTDKLIGKLLSLYGPEDLVIVLSDHGFESGVDLMGLTGVHRGDKAIDGVFFARGPGVPQGQRLEERALNIFDVTPTILAWLGIPVAKDMDGRIADFLEVQKVPTIESYDGTPVERVGPVPSESNQVLIEQLRSLGYLK
jgi:predicted AlkP superfamily phosphohydrolase/phosphomutase